MEDTWKRVFTFNILLLVICITCVESYSQSRYNGSDFNGTIPKILPVLTPICDDLNQPPCDYTYSTDKKTGATTFDYFLETCSHQQCVSITPIDPSPPPPRRRRPPPPPFTVPPPPIIFVKKNVYSNTTTSRPPITFPKTPARKRLFPEVRYYTVDKEGRFIRSGSHWFCTSNIVGYMARVETGTGLSPGTKEDQWAECQFARYSNFAGLGIDCELFRFGCLECARAYKYYLCAMAFPKCQPAAGGLSPTGTDIYGPDSIDPLLLKNLTYTITKPCRTLCYGVIRFCTNQMQFSCHLKEARDFADWPGCNTAGNSYGGELNV